MSMSILYSAKRSTPLSGAEKAKLSELVARFSVDDQIAQFTQTGAGPNWESFCVYRPDNPTEKNVVFEGATKLPDNSEDACWIGLQHWCDALSEIRRALPNAEWDLAVDDHQIHWDDVTQSYDPTQ